MLSSLKSRRRWLVALFVLCGIAVLWYVLAFPRGMLMAYFDHARGHYELKVYGGSPPDAERYSEYARLLRERYGVELNVVAQCVVTDELVRYAEGYNSTSRHLLAEMHGSDIFEECARLARKNWQGDQPIQ